MADVRPSFRQERGRQGRAHFAVLRIIRSTALDRLRRTEEHLLEKRGRRLIRIGGRDVRRDFDGDRARDLTARMATHPIGDRDDGSFNGLRERRSRSPNAERVLVLRAKQANVRAGVNIQLQESPIRHGEGCIPGTRGTSSDPARAGVKNGRTGRTEAIEATRRRCRRVAS